MCQYIVNKCIQPIDFGYNMLYLYRLLRVNIGSKRQAPGNRSTQSHASPKGTGRLPKTERMMSNNQATQKFWYYWTDILHTIPKNLFSSGFLFARRGGQIPLRFVLFPYIKDKKQNSRGDFLKYRRSGQTTPAVCFVSLYQNQKQNSRGNYRGRLPMQPTFLKVILILGIAFGLTVPAFAAESKSANKSEKNVKAEKIEKKAEGRNVIKTEAKEITGQVSAISKDYIAVIYQTGKNTENEMGIYIEGIPELERVKDFGQIQSGDTVTVEYAVATERDKDDNEFARHMVKKIIFVKKAPPPPPETDVMISDEAEE